MMLVVLQPMAQVCDVIYTTVLWGGGGVGLEYILSNRDWATTLHEEV